MPNTEDKMGQLRTHFEKSTDGILEQIAERRELTLSEVIQCLPLQNVQHIDGQHFTLVMEQLSLWGKMTLIVHTTDVIMEFKGEVPTGSVGHGFYNLTGSPHLSGHLRYERCADIFLVERKFMKLDTAAVMFMNPEGQCMFKAFLSRNEDKSLNQEQMEKFKALPETISTIVDTEEVPA